MADLNKLINIVRELRSPGGCDWDRAQTSASLVPYLLEETYEVIEAIEENDGQLVELAQHRSETVYKEAREQLFDSLKTWENKLKES